MVWRLSGYRLVVEPLNSYDEVRKKQILRYAQDDNAIF